MKRIVFICGIVVGCSVVAGSAFGRTVTVPAQINNGTVSIQAEGSNQLSEILTIQENEDIFFADLTYNEELPLGTEIEVWPAVEGETPPWELLEESFPFERNLWITDDRTGTYIRFDVTDIVRAWENEQIPNLGLVLRITSDTGEEGQGGGILPPGSTTAIEATLTYHIIPVRPLKKDVVDPPHRESDPKKVPRTEDGKPK